MLPGSAVPLTTTAPSQVGTAVPSVEKVGGSGATVSSSSGSHERTTTSEAAVTSSSVESIDDEARVVKTASRKYPQGASNREPASARRSTAASPKVMAGTLTPRRSTSTKFSVAPDVFMAASKPPVGAGAHTPCAPSGHAAGPPEPSHRYAVTDGEFLTA